MPGLDLGDDLAKLRDGAGILGEVVRVVFDQPQHDHADPAVVGENVASVGVLLHGGEISRFRPW